MGKGRIISHEGDGQYLIEILHDRTAIDAELTQIDANILEWTAQLSELQSALADAKNEFDAAQSALNSAINALVEDGGESRDKVTEATRAALAAASKMHAASLLVSEMRARILQAQSRKTELEDLPDAPTVTAWCADQSLELTGEVATAEVPGEPVTILVRPGFDDSAEWQAARDGQLAQRAGMQPHQAFWNAAVLPGWQKWKPTYRLGVLTDIDGDTATVLLDEETSSANGLSIDPPGGRTLVDVPIQYMDCDAVAFEVGDRVLVQFIDQDLATPRVIGFETDPRPCGLACYSYGFFGLVENEVLQLPTGESLEVDLSTSSSPGCWAAGGNPEKSDPRSPEQKAADAAAGKVWRPYVLLTGPQRAINAKQDKLLEQNGWLYCDPAGNPWRMTIEQSPVTEQNTVIFSVWRRRPMFVSEWAFSDVKLAEFEWTPELPQDYNGPWTADYLAQLIRATRWHSNFPNRNGSQLFVNVRSSSGIAKDVSPFTSMGGPGIETLTLLSVLRVDVTGTGDPETGVGITATITQTHTIDDLHEFIINTINDPLNVHPITQFFQQTTWACETVPTNEAANSYEENELVERTSTVTFAGFKDVDFGTQVREMDAVSILLVTPAGELTKRHKRYAFNSYSESVGGSRVESAMYQVVGSQGNRLFQFDSCNGLASNDIFRHISHDVIYTETVDVELGGTSVNIYDVYYRDFLDMTTGAEAPQNFCARCQAGPQQEANVTGYEYTTIDGYTVQDAAPAYLNVTTLMAQDQSNTIQVSVDFEPPSEGRRVIMSRLGISETGVQRIYKEQVQSDTATWPPPQAYHPVLKQFATVEPGNIIQFI